MAAWGGGEHHVQGQAGNHQVYHFHGTPSEVGFQHGAMLKDDIVIETQRPLEEYAKNMSATAEEAANRVLARYERVFARYVPGAVEEIKGISEGSGLPYPYVFFAAVRDGLKIPTVDRHACTSFVCGRNTTHNGKIIMGQNKDVPAPLDRYRIMCASYSNGRRSIILNYPGWLAANVTLTSDGVAFTGNSLYAREPEDDALPLSLLKRIIAEKSSVREIMDTIQELKFVNGSIQIGDRTGHLVCIEFAAGHMSVRDVSDQAFGHANSILTERLRQYEHDVLGSPSSPLRQSAMQSLLRRHCGHIDVEIMKCVLKDHTYFPLSICRHYHKDDPMATTAAVIVNLTDMEMDIAIGNPCVAPFIKYSIANVSREDGV